MSTTSPEWYRSSFPGRLAGGPCRSKALFPLAILICIFGTLSIAVPPSWRIVSVLVKIEITVLLSIFTFHLLAYSLTKRLVGARCTIGGTPRFATHEESAFHTKSQTGLIIGRDSNSGKFLRYDGPAHLLTMASARTGAGANTIIPNLLTANRPVVCIDPNGESAHATGAARRQFGAVHVLDPFGITNLPTAAFNPLQALDLLSADIAEDVRILADALFVDEPDTLGSVRWDSEAKELVTGLILMILAVEPPDRRHLCTLLEYFRLPKEQFEKLLFRMQETKDCDGLIASIASRHLGYRPGHALAAIYRARCQIRILRNANIDAVFKHSTFSFAELRREAATVFLVLPSDCLSTYSRWLRLLISQSVIEITRSEQKPQTPVLFLLDEFASLGQLMPVESAMETRSGSGIQLWPILQDARQLRAVIRRNTDTFISNVGVLQIFGISDQDTACLVSTWLGQETTDFQVRSLD
ncbi:TRAG family protein, partial [Rhizobium sp. PDO1-076]|uniref:type IV secretory system conjugative DNA transfer family protein n=1 Tax=Rhizobium sp. PDO1-076 TaxID=1125979 RepID=UPI00024E3B23